MKEFFMKIAIGYLYIGLFWAFFLELSWTWSFFATIFTEFDLVFSFAGFMTFGFSFFVHMFIEPIIRALLWLPSILSLLSPDIPVGFIQWAVPGFFEHLVSNV